MTCIKVQEKLHMEGVPLCKDIESNEGRKFIIYLAVKSMHIKNK